MITISALAVFAAALVFPVGMLTAGIMDVLTMKISNRLVMLIGLTYMVLAPLAGFDLHELGSNVVTGLVVLFGAFVLFALGWIGGGDAKLAGVTALWFGTDHTLAYLTYTALFGGVLTLFLLQFRRMAIPASLQGRPWLSRLHAVETGVPYGVAMAAAALLVFSTTPWLAG